MSPYICGLIAFCCIFCGAIGARNALKSLTRWRVKGRLNQSKEKQSGHEQRESSRALLDLSSRLGFKSRHKYQHDLLDSLEVMCRSLETGSGLISAIQHAANRNSECADDLKQVIYEMNNGSTFSNACESWQERRPEWSVKLVVAGLSASKTTGASAVKAIQSAADSIRHSLNAQELAATHATQARSSVWVLTVLPILTTGPLLFANSAAREFLFASIPGIFVLVLGLSLNLLGAFWMKLLVNRASV